MPAYQDYIARAQVSEAFTLADGLKTSISTNRQNGTCFAPATGTTATTTAVDGVDTITGKYGKAEILEEKKANKLICGIKYTFHATNVSDKLTSKTITLKVDEDSGKLTLETVKGGNTTVENKHLPSAFKK